MEVDCLNRASNFYQPNYFVCMSNGIKKVHIISSLNHGFALWQQRPWYFSGLAAAVTGMFVLASSEALVTALAAILYVGYLSVFFKHYHGGHVVFDDLFSIDRRWINFAFLTVIKTALILLGLLCLIVPGIYLAIRWMFAEYLIIDKDLRPLEALKASSELTQGCRGKLFWYSVLVVILLVLGLSALIVGVFFLIPLIVFAKIKIYYDLQAAADYPN